MTTQEEVMRRVAVIAIALVAVAAPLHAAVVNVEITGTVEWNFARTPPLSDVNPGDPVTMQFAVDSDVFTNSPNFPVRGYDILMDSYSVTVGAVTVGILDPYYPGRKPNFTIRNNDPVADGFFISDTNIDFPFPGVPLETSGICGQFEGHFDVSYIEPTLGSLDVLDALGTYGYDGLTRFYFNLVDCGFEVVGLLFEQMTILPEPVEVAVDVKPGSCPNPVNAKSQGLVPAAILGSGELDVTTIDPASVRLGGVAPVRSGFEDVGTPFEPYVSKFDCTMDCDEYEGDGYTDLTLKFNARELAAALGSGLEDECVVATLTGYFLEEFGGGPIVGEDVIVLKNDQGGGGSRSPERMPLGDRLTPGSSPPIGPTGDDSIRNFGRAD
jgi:hypothetical protein